jgi:hypothetical protein
MGLFDRKKPVTAGPAPSATGGQSRSLSDLRSDPNFIPALDEFGREVFLTKEEWRTRVLPKTVKANWNNPEQLYGI